MISNKKLLMHLSRRGHTKRDIIPLAGISESTYQKLVKGEAVRMGVLAMIYDALSVDIGDVCSLRGYFSANNKREHKAIFGKKPGINQGNHGAALSNVSSVPINEKVSPCCSNHVPM